MSSSTNRAAAAVAIIKSLVPQESFLLLRRTTHPEDPWSGHFAFPGGRKEEGDHDLLSTCIRETREETGIHLSPDQLQQRLPLEAAGQLLEHPLWVAPFLFTIPQHPPLILNEKEIASACWLKAIQFQNLKLHKKVEMLPGRLFPAYPLSDYYLWGFTYRLLQALLLTNNTQK